MKIKIDKIDSEGSTQPRYIIDDKVVTQYREEMEAGAKFPAVIVFYDGKTYWLADGFHRLFAAKELGCKSIDCDVKKGTQRDAILYSCGANATHGLPRTNLDKRQAVETLLRDEEWAKWSDHAIAEQCAVSQPFASKLRGELTDNRYQSKKRKGRDGRTTKTGSKARKKAKQKAPAPDEEPEEEPETEEATDQDSPGLRRLKHAWQAATEEERDVFWDWARAQ